MLRPSHHTVNRFLSRYGPRAECGGNINDLCSYNRDGHASTTVFGGQVRLRSTPVRMGFTDPLLEPLALPALISLVSVGIEPTPDSG